MSKSNLFLAGAAALALIGCSQASTTTSNAPAVDTAAIATVIRANETQMQADWAARDAAKIASHYASDAVFMTPGAPAFQGHDAIQAAITAGPLTDHGFALTWTTDDVQVAASGDLAFSRGKYEEHDTNARTHHVDVSTGSYVTVYKKQSDGGWLAVADINTPEPAAMPAPAH